MLGLFCCTFTKVWNKATAWLQPSRAICVNNNCPFSCVNVDSVVLQVKQHCSLKNESVFQGNVHTVQTSQPAKKQNRTAMQHHRRTNVVFLNDWLHTVARASSLLGTTDDMTWALSSAENNLAEKLILESRSFKAPFFILFPPWAASVTQSIGQSRRRQFLWGGSTVCQERFCSWQATVSWQH